MNKLIIFICLVVSAILLLFAPIWKVNVVPSWRIKVVDQANKPIRGEPVVQYWKHYSYQIFTLMPDEALGRTDLNGTIEFPERNIDVSTAVLVIGKIWPAIPLLNDQFGAGPRSFLVCQRSKCSSETYAGGEMPELTTITTE